MGLIRFAVHPASLIDDWPEVYRGYLTGADGRVFSTRIEVDGGIIGCRRTSSESCKFHVAWPVLGFGRPVVATASLPERDEPYLLPVELARGKIVQVRNQASQWELSGMRVPPEFAEPSRLAHRAFAKAASCQDRPEAASQLANEALHFACAAAEILTHGYAEQALLGRLQRFGGLPASIGCELQGSIPNPDANDLFSAAFNSATIAVPWRKIEAVEGEYDWGPSDRQLEWCEQQKLMVRGGPLIDLGPEGLPPWLARWEHDIFNLQSFVPLHVVRGTAAIANGGILLRPTILARNDAETRGGETRGDEAHGPEGTRVMQVETSDTMRKIMRLVVTDGYGKPADVPGYYPGGKTGTAEKVAAHGGYKKHTNVAAFMSVFPMQRPRYAVYMMLDEPKANASTHGYATAGWVAAPAAGRVIGRIAPMLGMLPEIDNMVQINQSLAMPLQPTRPAHGVPMAGKSPAPAVPLRQIPTSAPPVLRDPRHEAQAPASDPAPNFPQGPIGASVVPANIRRIAAPRVALQNAAR